MFSLFCDLNINNRGLALDPGVRHWCFQKILSGQQPQRFTQPRNKKIRIIRSIRLVCIDLRGILCKVYQAPPSYLVFPWFLLCIAYSCFLTFFLEFWITLLPSGLVFEFSGKDFLVLDFCFISWTLPLAFVSINKCCCILCPYLSNVTNINKI